MNNMKLVLGFVAALGFGTTVNAATELVTNGGFETANFAGWTQGGNLGFTGVNSGQQHSGSYAAYLGPIGSDGVLAQTLSTVTNKLYNITFWLAHDGGTANDFSVKLGSTTLTSFANAGAFGYTLFAFSAKASSAADALAFNFRQDPAYYHLDDVSVTAAVPVPAALPLLLVGLGGLGFVGRKSRKKSV